jgi:23S rRNA (cytosine1962-C5)-methyltransferase
MTPTARLILKPGKESSLRRYHPWVFSGAIERTEGSPAEGDLAEVCDASGQRLGLGHWQPGSIALRVLSFGSRDLGAGHWEAQIARALALRRSLGLWENPDTSLCRLVHGEGDGLPGLVVDWYEGLAVIQAHSAGFYRARAEIAEALRAVLGPALRAVYDKSAHTLRLRSGEQPQEGYLWGGPEDWAASEYGKRYRIAPEGGQKTGFFIDQRESRRLLERYAAGQDLLNLFCYSGGFSVAGLAGGAALVHSVDSSKKAIELTEENVRLNFGEEGRHASFAEDVFDFLAASKRQYSRVVVDPPAFAKRLSAAQQALRGYRRLNEAAIRKVAPGGLMFTFSCSQAVSREQFREAVFSAAAAAGRQARILFQLTQPPDHPVNIYHPEGEYLKGLVLEVG